MSKTISATIADSEYNALRATLTAEYNTAVAKADELEASIDEVREKLTERMDKRDALWAKASEKRATFVALFGVEP